MSARGAALRLAKAVGVQVSAGGLPFGRLLGVPLRIHPSALPVAVMFTWAAGVQFREWHPQSEPVVHFGLGLACYLCLAASLLVHEFAHVLAARRFGTATSFVGLNLFGMVAALTSDPRHPKEEFVVAGLGPLASVALSFGAYGVHAHLPPGSYASDLAWFAMTINAVIAAFNMVPCFPMDGGRMLRAAAWGLSGDVSAATTLAARIGLVAAAVIVGVGVLQVWGGNPFGLLTVAVAFAVSSYGREEARRRRAEAVRPKARDFLRPFGRSHGGTGLGLTLTPLPIRGEVRPCVVFWEGEVRVTCVEPHEIPVVTPESSPEQVVIAIEARRGWGVAIVSDGRPLGFVTIGAARGLVET